MPAGEQGVGVTTITANYAANEGDIILANADGGSITVTLPNATNGAAPISIYKIGTSKTNTVTIAAATGQTALPANNLVLTNPADCVTFVDTGTSWYDIQAKFPAKSGSATLAAGTVTVADTNITATSVIRLAPLTISGTAGALFISAKTAATSFVINSTSGSDTSVVRYDIVVY